MTMNATNSDALKRGKFITRLEYVLLILMLWIPISVFSQKTPDQTFTIENYYRVKWGYSEEFLDLYKRNHYPLLKKAIEKGDLISITIAKPRQHVRKKVAGTTVSRWCSEIFKLPLILTSLNRTSRHFTLILKN